MKAITFQGQAERENIKLGLVVSRFNSEITEKLEKGALQYCEEIGLRSDQVYLVRVPGAFEIPLAAKQLLLSDFSGVVALGAVIRGDTPHFDYVCQSVERACTQLQLDFVRPVSFGVLTTENEDQALARCGGSHGNKGYDAVQVAIEMIDLTRKIRGGLNE